MHGMCEGHSTLPVPLGMGMACPWLPYCVPPFCIQGRSGDFHNKCPDHILTKDVVLNQSCVEQVEAVAGLGSGAGRKFLVRLPPDMPAGVAYLELQQGPFVGGACPVLVMPPELAAAAGELLHALQARDALLKCSSSGGRSY